MRTASVTTARPRVCARCRRRAQPVAAVPPLTRRRFIEGAIIVGAGFGLFGCGDDGDAAATTTAAAEPWSFTDDVGTTVTLDRRPTRIAGLTDEISALWNFGIVPIAGFGFAPMADDRQFAGKDLSQVAEVGSVYGEINLERLAELKPDLIVTTIYSTDPGELLYGFESEAQLALVREIAPVVAIAQVGSAVDVIARNAELAAALGVDLAGGPVAEAKRDFDDASARLRAAGDRGIVVECIAAYAGEGVYLAKAPDDPALRMYRDLGVDFVEPTGADFYWEVLSWEEVDRYPADLILFSPRAMQAPELLEQPSFAALPAAAAGQLHEWKAIPMDYTAQAAYMNELSGWLEAAAPVV